MVAVCLATMLPARLGPDLTEDGTMRLVVVLLTKVMNET
jgi:hypothetical protein